MALLDSLPDSLSIYEVSPRDGLQNESAAVPTHAKARLIDALIAAGIRRVEATSFVSPRWIPQLADASDLMGCLGERPEVRFSALVPNGTGLRRAIRAGLKEVAIFVSVSETHNLKNVNKSVAETLRVFEPVCDQARAQGVAIRAYVSTVWGCPYEGETDTARAVELAEELVTRGAYQVSLGDTIGVGTPLQTRRILEAFFKKLPREKVALHLHDTRGTALANALVGLEMGVTTFDSSIAGLGGCPYAPGAAGNLATEDLVYVLDRMGIATGIDLQKLWRAGQVAEAVVGRKLPGKVHQAGIESLVC